MSKETGLDGSIKNNQSVRLLKSRKYWMWVIVVILIVLAIFLLKRDYINNGVSKKPSNQPKCSNAILEQAAANFDPSSQAQAEKLQQIVSNIQKISGYQQDANCMYVVLTYYINIGDPTSARTYLNGYEKVYNPDKGLSTKLGNKVLDKESLENIVSSMGQGFKSTQDNALYFSNP